MVQQIKSAIALFKDTNDAQLWEAYLDGIELASSWQLLDLDVLEHDPLRGVWFLHTQPPLQNLVIGLVAWSPLPLAGTVFVLYAGCLVVLGLLVHDLLIRWVCRTSSPPSPAATHLPARCLRARRRGRGSSCAPTGCAARAARPPRRPAPVS